MVATVSPPASGPGQPPPAGGGVAVDRRRTFLVGVAGLVAVTAGLMVAVVIVTRGTLTYTIDDAYIHLSMARNLAGTGGWGVVPGDWQSADSSPGWVLLLALLIRVAGGLSEWWPFAVNGAAAVGVVWIFAHRQDLVVLRRGRNSPWRYAAVLLLPTALYLPAQIMLGMEHIVQAVLMLGILLSLERLVRGPVTLREVGVYALLSLLGSAIRFETIFLSVGAGLVLVVPPALAAVRRRRWGTVTPAIAAAAAGGVAALLPIVIMGAVDLAHGAYFFPNSIVEKTALLGHASLLQSLLPSWANLTSNLAIDPFLDILLLAALAIAVFGGPMRRVWTAWLIGGVLQAAYGQFGWNDRLQAALVIAGMLLSLRTLPAVRWPVIRRHVVLLTAVLLLVLPVGKYAFTAYVPYDAQSEILVQQQMARFLATDYDGQTVMVNDIGRVTWLHRGGLLDVWGLATFDVVQAQHDGEYDADYMTTLARRDHVAAVAVYAPTFDFLIPHGYVEVASWTIGGGGNSLARAVVFYAPQGAAAETMRLDMQRFQPTMDPGSGAVTILPG